MICMHTSCHRTFSYTVKVYLPGPLSLYDEPQTRDSGERTLPKQKKKKKKRGQLTKDDNFKCMKFSDVVQGSIGRFDWDSYQFIF